ncbi:MAG: hypothetical protein JSR76_04580 [Verrucomicrobia bacterium]|nr:hypothetical protein [Verrucomicrobiota bacterium]
MKRFIGHMALVVGPDQIFHCKNPVGAVVQSVKEVWRDFEQSLTKKDIFVYIDPRNKPLREKYGTFLPSYEPHTPPFSHPDSL